MQRILLATLLGVMLSAASLSGAVALDRRVRIVNDSHYRIIAFYATGSANWGMAGALGAVLLVATLLLYSVYARLSAEEPGRR